MVELKERTLEKDVIAWIKGLPKTRWLHGDAYAIASRRDIQALIDQLDFISAVAWLSRLHWTRWFQGRVFLTRRDIDDLCAALGIEDWALYVEGFGRGK